MTKKTAVDIQHAANVLKAGGLVAFPTETVYGLGADARNEVAIRKIFQAKERPYDHPLIVHIADINQITSWACDIPATAYKLAEAFWPGPLTLVLKKQPGVLDSLTGGQQTVGLRIPGHPIALALLQAFGGGVAAPSANKFTHVSPTTAQAVQEELGDKVDLILDGGACAVGLESTIIDLSHDQATILRPGMITKLALEKLLGVVLSERKSAVRAPGMHHLHYAPSTKTVLIDSEQLPTFIATLKPDDLPLAVLSYHEIDVASENIQQIRMPHDATSYAHDLYQTLRSVDRQPFKCIVIEKVPDGVEWDAIRDRLKKAAHDVSTGV